MLGDRHETEMTITPDEHLVATQTTDHRQAEWLDGLAQHQLVRVGRDPVQHHACDPHARIVIAIAAHERGDGPAHRRRVDDEQHRRVEQSRHVCRRRRLTVDGAVEETHDAFDDEEVRTVLAARDAQRRRSNQFRTATDRGSAPAVRTRPSGSSDR